MIKEDLETILKKAKLLEIIKEFKSEVVLNELPK